MKKLLCTVLLFVFATVNFAVSAAVDKTLYTTNLFGDSFYECGNSDIGAVRYTAEVDTTEYHDGTSSVKLTGTGRQLFVKTVNRDLRGKKVNISFWLKADTTASFANQAKISYKIGYNDGDDKELAAVDTNIGTITTSGWQKFETELTIDDAALPQGATFTGIEFSVYPNGTSPVGLKGGAFWVDQISLRAIPKKNELPTAVTAMSATQNPAGQTESVLLTLDTDFVSADSIKNMTASLNGSKFTAYTADIIDLGDTANIKINFKSAQMLTKFSVSGIKDIWGYDVAVNASISVETVQTFTENLLGEKFTKCESDDIAAGFAHTVDTAVKADGNGSLKFYGSESAEVYGADLFKPVISVSKDDAPESIKLSMRIKLQENTTVKGSGSTDEYAVNTFRFYYDLIYTDSNGNSKELTPNNSSGAIPDGTLVSCDATGTQWQYITYTYTPNYKALPEGANLTGVKVYVRPYKGIYCCLHGAIWIDKIVATRVPAADKYVPEFLGTEPTNGNENAPTGSVVFKFKGAVESGYLTNENVLINDKKTDVSITDSYDSDTNITKVMISPTDGFKNKEEYNVKLTGVRDLWGRVLPDEYSVNFKTIDKLTVTNSFAAVGDGGSETPISAMQSGTIKAEFEVKNNTQAAKTAVVVVAACKGDTINRFAISASKTVGIGDTETISATVTAQDGEYLRAFLWDGTSTHRPMAAIAELR